MSFEGRSNRDYSLDGDDIDPLAPLSSTYTQPCNDSRQLPGPSNEGAHDQRPSHNHGQTHGSGIPLRPLPSSFAGMTLSPETSASASPGSEADDKVADLPGIYSREQHGTKGITWTVNPFREGAQDAVHEREVRFVRSDTEGSGRRGPVSNTLRKGSVVAKEAMRKGSVVALEALDSVNILREIGNPLDIQINETRRVSSAAFAKVLDFEGRRTSSTRSSLTRKPSMFQTTAIVLRATDDPEDYVIQRLAAHDDIEHMSKMKRLLYMTAPLWAFISLLSYWGYFALRIRFTLDAQNSAHKTFAMAWTFVAVEIGVAIPMVMHRSWSMLMIRGRRRPKLRLVGNQVPSVDVIITCCGEDDELVLDTAMAACNVDYPADRFRVLILDDGASAGLRALVEDPSKYPFENMHYLSRPKYPGVPHHFKAGNLNYALAETKLMPGGAANFFAALDADMIPEKDWLRALLPHLLQDLNCSMACPPQQFYNVPKDDPLCQSLDTFIHISEPLKDALGVAWCTGSGYIMRRDALDSIGWFPLGSLAEDVCTSSMLLGAGWKTCFVHEPLQFGTVPDSLSGHLKQRTRWTIGTIQTSIKLRFCLYGPLVKHMSVMQRASGFVYTVSSLFTIFLVLSMFTVPVVLYSGGTMVPYVTLNQLVWLVRFCFFTMIINRINEFIVYLPSGYGVGQRDARGMMWMAPYHALSVFQSFILPKWMGGKIAVFTSTGSQSSELNERDERLRAPMIRRLKVTMWDCQAFIHVFYILFVLGAIGLSTYYCITTSTNHDARDYLTYLLTHAGWPPILWMVCIVSCWAPIQYAIDPPTVPDRDHLLQREEKTRVAYPTSEARKVKQSSWHMLHELQYSLVSIYTAGLFVVSFWM